jgi:adhesin HecA-like repeat protein
MRSHVADRSLADPSCLALTPGGACDDLVLSDRTISSAESHSTCGTLFAGPNVRVTGTGALTLTAGRVVLRSGFSVASGGRLTATSMP